MRWSPTAAGMKENSHNDMSAVLRNIIYKIIMNDYVRAVCNSRARLRRSYNYFYSNCSEAVYETEL